MNRKYIISTILGLSLAVGGSIAVNAQDAHHTDAAPSAFPRIQQPLGLKVGVTLAGLSLVGLDLWWFLFSKPRSRQAESTGGIQEITITVDGGYDPAHVTLQAGQPVRLNFVRQDASSCLEEVRLPDFQRRQFLTLNQVTPIEFTPQKPGRYEFTCGMNMYRGVLDVQ